MAQDTPRTKRPTWLRAALLSIGFVALLWVIEAVDAATHGQLNKLGIRPRSDSGLIGIVFAPLLHFGWAHLEGNTPFALGFLFLVLASGIGRGIAATAVIWVVGGVGVWVTARSGSVTGGASILIFGWLVYLIVRGIFSHRFLQIVLGVAIFLLYGGLLLEALPGQEGISWQGHLFGGIGGALAAWLLNDPADRLPDASAKRS